jgi:hypothetical protein
MSSMLRTLGLVKRGRVCTEPDGDSTAQHSMGWGRGLVKRGRVCTEPGGDNTAQHGTGRIRRGWDSAGGLAAYIMGPYGGWFVRECVSDSR